MYPKICGVYFVKLWEELVGRIWRVNVVKDEFMSKCAYKIELHILSSVLGQR